jgi:beta-lactamase regulating signal transducer with metallopeptidase domain
MTLPDSTLGTTLAVLGTYLAHSTVLLSLAWLLADRLKTMRAQEWAWRTALLGGLITTGLQVGFSMDPLAGRLALEDQEQALALPAGPGRHSAQHGAQNNAHHSARPTPAVMSAIGPAATPAEASTTPVNWKPIVLGTWGLGGLLVGAGFLLALARLRRHLASRERLTDGPLADQLEALESAFPVARSTRLYASPRLAAPIAHGWLRPSITVPARASADLHKDEQRALLAHELGHLQRRDPAWLTLARLLEIALFIQPLNRIAHRRLATLAEYQCDAAALQATDNRVALARCLTEVAGWIVGTPRPLPVCSMADQRSPLAARVVRILEVPNNGRERLPLGTSMAALAAVSAVVLAAPGVAAPSTPGAPDPIAEVTEVIDVAEPADASFGDPSPVAQPSSGLEVLDAALLALRQQQVALMTELERITQVLTEREPSPELLNRLSTIEQRAANLAVRSEQLQVLVAQLNMASAPTTPSRRGSIR